MTRLSQVFSLHRFIAAYFSFMLVFFLDSIDRNMSELSVKERIILQSWGVCIAIVSIITHEARNLNEWEQHSLGTAIAFGLVAELAVHGSYLWKIQDVAMVEGVRANMIIFLALFVAYLWGITEPVVQGSSQIIPSKYTLVLTGHYILAVTVGSVAVICPQSLYWFVPNSDATRHELFCIQCWGSFIVVLGFIAGLTRTFVPSTQMILTSVLGGVFPLTSLIYIWYWRELDVLYTYGSFPVFIPMTLWYGYTLFGPTTRAAYRRHNKLDWSTYADVSM